MLGEVPEFGTPNFEYLECLCKIDKLNADLLENAERYAIFKESADAAFMYYTCEELFQNVSEAITHILTDNLSALEKQSRITELQIRFDTERVEKLNTILNRTVLEASPWQIIPDVMTEVKDIDLDDWHASEITAFGGKLSIDIDDFLRGVELK